LPNPQKKGKPDHAASPLLQEHNALNQAKLLSGLEQSDNYPLNDER
jgi:hypothetical protein